MATSEGIQPFRGVCSGLSANRSSPPSGPPMSWRCFTSSTLGLVGTCPLSAETTARRPISDAKVLFDDDGNDQLHGAVGPLTRQEIEFRVNFLVDPGIDAVDQCTSGPDLFRYNTKVGECPTSHYRLSMSNSPRRWLAADNPRRLIESGDEPRTVIVERCHQHGIPFAATNRSRIVRPEGHSVHTRPLVGVDYEN